MVLRRPFLKSFFILGLISVGLMGVMSCGLTDDQSAYAVIEGYVYTDSTLTHPAQGVYVIAESDVTSSVPYTGPDVMTWTDSTGFFHLEVYLGHSVQPDSLPTYTYMGDVAVSYHYEGRSFQWTGVSVHSGGVFRLPPVHLGMFQ